MRFLCKALSFRSIALAQRFSGYSQALFGIVRIPGGHCWPVRSLETRDRQVSGQWLAEVCTHAL